MIPSAPRPRGIRFVEAILFNVKWILPLFYLGLVAVMLLYGFAFAKQIIATILEAQTVTTDEMKVVVLDFVDVVMVANLVKQIITGSYNSYISKEHGRLNENMSSGTLKIKISTSILIVCSIHLLRTFVSDQATIEEVTKQVYIYGAFLVGTIILGIMEYLYIKGEAIEKRTEHQSRRQARVARGSAPLPR